MYTIGTTPTGDALHAVPNAGVFEDPSNTNRKAFCGVTTVGRRTGNNPYVTCQRCKKAMFATGGRFTFLGDTVEVTVKVTEGPGVRPRIDRVYRVEKISILVKNEVQS